jgi:hypothetical protein
VSEERTVCWFSAGAASAVATMLTLRKRLDHPVVVARIHIAEEDPDNDRFAADCAAWFGVPIISLTSSEYASAEEVWTKRRYMSGPAGAPCTGEMKKAVRFEFEAAWQPTQQVFGYTAEENRRANIFRQQNPGAGLVTPLIDEGLTKDDCFALIQRAGIVLPLSYRQGFPNANCRGCVKAQSPGYWNLTRKYHPEVFARRVALSRELGVRLVKLTSGERERIFLDELEPTDMSDDGSPNWDCTIACAISESRIKEPTP